jgi:hypothetical protein
VSQREIATSHDEILPRVRGILPNDILIWTFGRVITAAWPTRPAAIRGDRHPPFPKGPPLHRQKLDPPRGPPLAERVPLENGCHTSWGSCSAQFQAAFCETTPEPTAKPANSLGTCRVGVAVPGWTPRQDGRLSDRRQMAWYPRQRALRLCHPICRIESPCGGGDPGKPTPRIGCTACQATSGIDPLATRGIDLGGRQRRSQWRRRRLAEGGRSPTVVSLRRRAEFPDREEAR